MPTFNPHQCLGDKPPRGESFQINHFRIDGELGKRAVKAARASGLSNTKFAQACVRFALDHMETTNAE